MESDGMRAIWKKEEKVAAEAERKEGRREVMYELAL